MAVMASPVSKNPGTATVWNVAERLGYQTLPAELVRDPKFSDTIRAERVDVLLNVHSLYIISSQVLDAPRFGSFNMHPGPLPRYAGLNAVSWALYRGETSHGVTIHKMEPEIDVGSIVYEKIFKIEDADTGLSLSLKCVREGLEFVSQLLDVLSSDPEGIQLVRQDLSKREYFGREVPNGGRLVWSRNAREVTNFIRACDYYPFHSPWGQPRARLGDKEVGIMKASLTGVRCDEQPGSVGQMVESGVQVACADEWIVVKKLKLDSRLVNAADLLKTGERLDDGSER